VGGREGGREGGGRKRGREGGGGGRERSKKGWQGGRERVTGGRKEQKLHSALRRSIPYQLLYNRPHITTSHITTSHSERTEVHTLRLDFTKNSGR